MGKDGMMGRDKEVDAAGAVIREYWLIRFLHGTGTLYLLTQSAVFLKFAVDLIRRSDVRRVTGQLAGVEGQQSAVIWLVGVLLVLGGSFWYMKAMIKQFPVWFFAAALAVILAGGFLSSHTAFCYYCAFNLQILSPVLMAGYGIRMWKFVRENSQHRRL